MRQVSLRAYLFTVALVLLLSLGTIQYIVAQSPQHIFSLFGFAKTSSYVILKSGSTFYAVDGTYGTELTSGADAAQVTQATINALNSSGLGGRITVQEGIYSFSTGLTLYPKVSFGGLGHQRAPRLDFDLTASEVAFDLPDDEGSNVVIENLRIHNIGDTGTGLYFNHTHGVVVRSVAITSMKRSGIELNSTSYSNSFYDCQFNGNGGHGVYLGLSSAGNSFYNSDFGWNTKSGLRMETAGARNSFYNCLFEANGEDGVLTTGTVSFYNCNFELNTGNQATVGANFFFSGCQFQSAQSGTYGLHITGYRGTVVSSGFNNNWKDIKFGSGAHHIVVQTCWGLDDLVFSSDSHNIAFVECEDFVTENNVNGTISSGTSVSIAHGLAGTPDYVFASFNTTGWTSWGWTANATYVDITVETSGTYEVYCKVKYVP